MVSHGIRYLVNETLGLSQNHGRSLDEKGAFFKLSGDGGLERARHYAERARGLLEK